MGEGLLDKKDLLHLLSATSKSLKREPNVAKLQEPIFIVGDVHGQYYDLIHMFEKAIDGRFDLNSTSLLFLGDYVDRGRYGLEIVVFLYALRMNFPKTVVLLRGNHESAAMTDMFTFREEVLEKYGGDEFVYEAFLESFEAL